jgi:hypothetical protein
MVDIEFSFGFPAGLGPSVKALLRRPGHRFVIILSEVKASSRRYRFSTFARKVVEPLSRNEVRGSDRMLRHFREF